MSDPLNYIKHPEFAGDSQQDVDKQLELTKFHTLDQKYARFAERLVPAYYRALRDAVGSRDTQKLLKFCEDWKLQAPGGFQFSKVNAESRVDVTMWKLLILFPELKAYHEEGRRWLRRRGLDESIDFKFPGVNA